jgi:cytochrome P450
VLSETDVPAEIGALIVSPRAYASQKELLAGFRWLRRHNRIGRVQAEGFDTFWTVTRHADIVEVSRRHDLFNNSARSTALVPRAADDLARAMSGGSPHLMRALLQMDGPQHSRYRQITQSWFARQSVELLDQRIRRLAACAVDDLALRGGACDFVGDVALRFPLQVMMGILGLPAEDEPLLLSLLQELLRSQDEAATTGVKPSRDPARHTKRLVEAFTGFEKYFVPLMLERRKNPRGDLASLIAAAEPGGEPIGQFEAVSYYMLLVTAGYHTTASAISGAIWALCENAHEFLKVKADPGLLPLLVEEAVRWTTPAHHMMRTATADTHVHGRRIAKGDWLMLCYLSANRDDEVFTEADRFRIEPDRTRNLAFGYGAHACLGQHLARQEMRVFFEELFRRLGRIELLGAPRRMASVFLGGPRTLPVKCSML